MNEQFISFIYTCQPQSTKLKEQTHPHSRALRTINRWPRPLARSALPTLCPRALAIPAAALVVELHLGLLDVESRLQGGVSGACDGDGEVDVGVQLDEVSAAAADEHAGCAPVVGGVAGF
ncbi:hypothetical protein P153DRAFT_369311 [Dothidotthia symphoricarpi CBS 119687]|uniref:Uncharacterized protein n=1 Tax=Dothidotthia symphoricarpi CBS 119687 TaxID=1392245 RepID=A0A6A6A497_9PLEO|nr:uncharacterized protein P153DRAFT_369311 [Dothidotthia symphoricarpi CBS 119687]KAF2126630.1 hypothetical protein P153DRAFT_369311 [Dothidotthia symphoricarpi CBS 119687]